MGALTLATAGVRVGAYGAGAAPVVDAGGADNAISFAVDDITIQDIEVIGWDRRGIHNSGGQRPTVQRCVFSGGDGTAGSANTAIRFFCNAGPYIEGAVVRDCTFETIASGTAATAAQKQSIFFTALLLQDCNDFVELGRRSPTPDRPTLRAGSSVTTELRTARPGSSSTTTTTSPSAVGGTATTSMTATGSGPLLRSVP
jgi:hypothetical protein